MRIGMAKNVRQLEAATRHLPPNCTNFITYYHCHTTICFHAPHGGVIPPDILVTNLKPDLFLVNESERVIVLLELTCPWDSNIERSHNYKEEKYAPLIADLSRNFNVYQFSIEVSVRGQISKGNRARIKSFAYRCCRGPRMVSGALLKSCSKLSLLCSYSIFCARKEPSWSSPRLLAVR